MPKQHCLTPLFKRDCLLWVTQDTLPAVENKLVDLDGNQTEMAQRSLLVQTWLY